MDTPTPSTPNTPDPREEERRLLAEEQQSTQQAIERYRKALERNRQMIERQREEGEKLLRLQEEFAQKEAELTLTDPDRLSLFLRRANSARKRSDVIDTDTREDARMQPVRDALKTANVLYRDNYLNPLPTEHPSPEELAKMRMMMRSVSTMEAAANTYDRLFGIAIDDSGNDYEGLKDAFPSLEQDGKDEADAYMKMNTEKRKVAHYIIERQFLRRRDLEMLAPVLEQTEELQRIVQTVRRAQKLYNACQPEIGTSKEKTQKGMVACNALRSGLDEFDRYLNTLPRDKKSLLARANQFVESEETRVQTRADIEAMFKEFDVLFSESLSQDIAQQMRPMMRELWNARLTFHRFDRTMDTSPADAVQALDAIDKIRGLLDQWGAVKEQIRFVEQAERRRRAEQLTAPKPVIPGKPTPRPGQPTPPKALPSTPPKKNDLPGAPQPPPERREAPSIPPVPLERRQQPETVTPPEIPKPLPKQAAPELVKPDTTVPPLEQPEAPALLTEPRLREGGIDLPGNGRFELAYQMTVDGRSSPIRSKQKLPLSLDDVGTKAANGVRFTLTKNPDGSLRLVPGNGISNFNFFIYRLDAQPRRVFTWSKDKPALRALSEYRSIQTDATSLDISIDGATTHVEGEGAVIDNKVRVMRVPMGYTVTPLNGFTGSIGVLKADGGMETMRAANGFIEE